MQKIKNSDYKVNDVIFESFIPDSLMIKENEIRKCLHCGDKLETGDDLICGYHHLEK